MQAHGKPCRGLRITLPLRALQAHKARMLTWMDRRINPARGIGVAELVGPKDAATASHALHKLNPGNGNRHSRSHLHSGQPQRSHEGEGVLHHGETRKDAQLQSPHAANHACRPEHRRLRGSERQWMSATARPRARDRTQLLAQQEMTMFLPRHRHAYRQLLRGRRLLLHHRGKWQLTSLHRLPCWSSQLATA